MEKLGSKLKSLLRRDQWKPFKQFSLSDLIPEHIMKDIRRRFFFPDTTGLVDQPFQSPLAEQKYRTPTAANMYEHGKIASVPKEINEKNIYDTKYYTRDARRHPTPVLVGRHPALPPDENLQLLEAEKQLEEKINKEFPTKPKPATTLLFDPTGTRSARTTTDAAMNKMIQEHMPTHYVRYEWEDAQEEILAECEMKGIPPVPGRPFPWKKVAIY